MFKGFKLSRNTPAAVAVVALLLSLAQSTTAQNATTATQAVTQTPQSQPQQATPPAQTDAPATPAGEAVAANGVVEPLYREYRGVTLGMSASDVRAKLGKPEEKSDGMDFYVF